MEIPAPFRTRVSVLQLGGSGDTSVDTVDTEPHVEALTQHAAERLAVPGASAALDIEVLMDSDSGITAMSEGLVEALRRQPEMMQTPLATVCWAYACGDVVGPGVVSAPPNDRTPVGTSPVYDAVHRAPGGRRCGYYYPEDLERKT